jgi:hypothetical protein
MIPAIGLMIGFYVITRCLEMFRPEASFMVRTMAVVTVIVSAVSMYALVDAGSAVNDALRSLHP